jgi:DNA-binding transcriptional MocR family regulator
MTRVIRGSQLVRLLGPWQSSGHGRRAVPDYLALADTLRALVTDGRLALDVRLPAERELAEALRVSRTTVTGAYNVLRTSGHLDSRRGAGSWTRLPGGVRVGQNGWWTPETAPDLIDFATAALAAPPEMAAAATDAVAALPRYLSGTGYHPTGLPELRTAVADAYTGRGVPTSPEQIMVTNGVQHALDLALRLLAPPGSTVLTESPTYPNALAAFAARRHRVHTYGVADGWDTELLLAAVRQTSARVAYLVPEFQNPTGHLMNDDLRAALPAVAHAAGTDLIIDETFVDLPLDELAADGATMPLPVAAHDRHARVISIGGMSKPYWGGLRIGWIRAAEPIVQRLTAVRVGVDMSGPVLDQLVAVELLTRADAIVPARRVQLRQQRDVLAAAVRRDLPTLRFTLPAGGVTLWAELDAPVSSALARSAETFGVRLAPGPKFGMDGTLERFVRLPFTLPGDVLVEAVARIAAAYADVARGSRRTWEAPALVA